MYDRHHFPLQHPAYKANVVRVHQNKYLWLYKWKTFINIEAPIIQGHIKILSILIILKQIFYIVTVNIIQLFIIHCLNTLVLLSKSTYFQTQYLNNFLCTWFSRANQHKMLFMKRYTISILRVAKIWYFYAAFFIATQKDTEVWKVRSRDVPVESNS